MQTNSPSFFEAPEHKMFGMVAQFDTAHTLLKGVNFIRGAGFRYIDTYSPFPIHGMDKALGLKPSRLPWLVLAGALTGALTGILMQAWMNGVDYAFRVGGKPFFAYQSYVPVAFELTVLFGAIATVFGMFALNKIPQPYHPLFTLRDFTRVTDDAFFVSVDAQDPNWDQNRLRLVMEQSGAKKVDLVFESEEIAS